MALLTAGCASEPELGGSNVDAPNSVPSGGSTSATALTQSQVDETVENDPASSGAVGIESGPDGHGGTMTCTDPLFPHYVSETDKNLGDTDGDGKDNHVFGPACITDVCVGREDGEAVLVVGHDGPGGVDYDATCQGGQPINITKR
jgi:hypothetical protein